MLSARPITRTRVGVPLGSLGSGLLTGRMIATVRLARNPALPQWHLGSIMASPERPAEPDSSPRKRSALLLVGGLAPALLMLLAGCGGGAEGESTTTSASTTAAGATIDCTPVPDDGGTESCPDDVIGDPANVDVKTSEGGFEIALGVKESPATTTSFRQLVEAGFYDGLSFSRVVPGFVIQGGDPLAGDQQRAGTGGPGYYVDEEVPPGTRYTQGVVAMAKAGTDPPGRSGSQFFVVSGRDAGLPPEYAFVGTVVSGLDTVKRIESLGIGDGPPRKEVTIESMTLVPASSS